LKIISTFVAKEKSLVLQWRTLLLIIYFNNLFDFWYLDSTYQNCGKSVSFMISNASIWKKNYKLKVAL